MGDKTMQAVVFKGKLKIAVEERPIPKIQEPTDIIVKVLYTALCGRYVSPAHGASCFGGMLTSPVLEVSSMSSVAINPRPPVLSWVMSSPAS